MDKSLDQLNTLCQNRKKTKRKERAHSHNIHMDLIEHGDEHINVKLI